MKRFTTGLAAAVCAVVPLVAVAAPADASTRWQFRSSGSFAQVDWVEMGALPGGVPGNVHLGFLRVEGDKNVSAFGQVLDWTCPEGEMPPFGGGGHEEPPAETNCTLDAERFVFGEGLTLVMDKKLGAAHLTGTLTVENHGGEGAPASPPVDMTWTGVGGTSSTTINDSYTDPNGTRLSTKRTETARGGTVSGRIGAMGFDDDADDTANGFFGTFRVMERGVTP